MYSVLYWIYCLAFAFDFRGEEGGSSVQYVFLLLAVASGVAIVVLGYRTLFTVLVSTLFSCGLLSSSRHRSLPWGRACRLGITSDARCRFI